MDPDAAIAYLRLLSTDLRAVAVLAPDGSLRAGDPGLAAAVPCEPGAVRAGDVLAVRGAAGAVAVRTGPHALDGLLLADLHGVLSQLDPA